METLSVQPRDLKSSRPEDLRAEGSVPGVLYGPKVEPVALSVDQKQFGKVYAEAGVSALVTVEIDGKEFPSLIHEVQKDPLTGGVVHVDFYQPDLTKEVEVEVPVVFEGEAPGVKDLGGTLLRNIQEVQVKALPQNLPHELVVSLEGLKTFEDRILVKDLRLAEGVSIDRDEEDVIAQVVPAEDVEAELETPIEEDIESVEGAQDTTDQEGAEGEEKTEGESAEEAAKESQ